jgi:LysM repeat protein
MGVFPTFLTPAFLFLLVAFPTPYGAGELVCTDSCLSAKEDGSCDDGGENSASAWCKLGSDCSDCGPREIPPMGKVWYTVKGGDTLNRIGETFGITPDSIQIRNGIADPRMLEAGANLVITDAALVAHVADTVEPAEQHRRRRVVAIARVLAYERLLGKKRYAEYVERRYGGQGGDEGDQKPVCSVTVQSLAKNPMHIIDRPFPSLDRVEAKYGYGPGSSSSSSSSEWWEPDDCTPRDTVAIIVPYRNRAEHLRAFLDRMHPFLRKQKVRYRIFIVDQVDEKPFNRAKLLNAGAVLAAQSIDVAKIAARNRRFCFIMHDVDLLPESDQTLYTCPDDSESPRHLSVYVDTHGKCLYKEIFGGVSVLNLDHFASVNGYANVYWGWGGEDDDMSARIRCGIKKKIARPTECRGPCKFFRDCIKDMERIVDYDGGLVPVGNEEEAGKPGHFVMIDGHSGTGKQMDSRNLVHLVNACKRFAGDGLSTLDFNAKEPCKYATGAFAHCQVEL